MKSAKRPPLFSILGGSPIRAGALGVTVGLVLGLSLGWTKPWQAISARDHGALEEDTLADSSYVEEGNSAPPSAQHKIARTTGPMLPLSFRGIAERSFPAVVFIALQYPNRNRVSEATGFVVDHGIVVTNFHVIDGTTGGEVNLIGQKERVPIQGVVASDPTRDLALLSVPNLDAQPLPLDGSDQVSVGDKIFVVGNPNGLEGTFSDGLVSGKREFKDFELLQITAPISAGSSGGPVIDVKGRVVGIAKGSWENGQNLNFAIPSTLVKRLLANRGEVQQFAKVTRPRYAPKKPPAPVVGELSPESGGFFSHVWHFFRL